jgi:hypothetical protein
MVNYVIYFEMDEVFILNFNLLIFFLTQCGHFEFKLVVVEKDKLF